MWRIRTACGNREPLGERGCLDHRVVLESVRLPGELVRNASNELAAAVGRTNLELVALVLPASCAPDEDRTTDVAPSLRLGVVARGAMHVVRQLDWLVRDREEGRKVGRVEHRRVRRFDPVGGGECDRREAGDDSDGDSECHRHESPRQRRSWSHVALLCSLVRQQ